MYQPTGTGALEIRTCKACCRDETGAVHGERARGGGTGLPRALGGEPCPALQRPRPLLGPRVLKTAQTLLSSTLFLLLDLKCLKTVPICSYPHQAKGCWWRLKGIACLVILIAQIPLFTPDAESS